MSRLVPIVLSICGAIVLAVFCLLCAAIPHRVATHARMRYSRSGKFTQNWPFARIVLKPWYPAYLRIVGVGGLLCMIVWLYAVLSILLQFPK
jgi:hypothetical protein